LLSSLAKDGFIVKMPDGRYQITEKGLEEIKEVLPPRKPRTTEDILNEIEGYISYLEEIGKDKISPYKSKIESIKSRLEKLI
jgi:DNA-binding PadR family transcriptional regulator